MEVQIPLVLFIAFCAVSAGIFSTQALLAIRGMGSGSVQYRSLAGAFIALVAGGVAVMFHLAQPLHIFNGFGNPTSGITQELVAIVVYFCIGLVYLASLRRSNDSVPVWCAILAIVSALALDIVCAHSYMMPSRPAWDSAFQILSVVGGSLAAGSAIVAALESADKSASDATAGKCAVAGAAIGLVVTVAYVVRLSTVSGGLATIGTYIDPTNPTAPVFDASNVSPFIGSALLPTCIALASAALALVCAVLGKRKGNWALFGTFAAVLSIAAIIALRITFYLLGVSVYSFYGITG